MTAQSAEFSVQSLERKFSNNPRSRVFSRLADAYRKRGDLRQAIDLCIEGLSEHPNYTTGRLVLGRCYLEQKNFSAAAGELKKICIVDRRNHAALKMLADVYIQQGQKDRAGNIYQILLEMEPDNPSLKQFASKFENFDNRNLFEILEISIPDVSASVENFLSAGINALTDVQELDTIQSEMPQISSSEPSAQDVEDRLDFLFGEQSAPDPIENATNQSHDFESATSPGIDPVDSDVSGTDVSSRLDELFGKTPESEGGAEEPFGLLSAETIQMNREELIVNAPDFSSVPSPDLIIETETNGNQLFDFEANETIQLDRAELSDAISKSGHQLSNTKPLVDLLLTQSQQDQTIVWNDDGDDISNVINFSAPKEPPAADVYDDGIDSPIVINEQHSPSGADIIETLDNLFTDRSDSESTGNDVPPTPSSLKKEIVSGNDIEERLSELFTETKKQPARYPDFDTSESWENNSEFQEQIEPKQIESIDNRKSSVSNDEVTGFDIEDRLIELFPDEEQLPDVLNIDSAEPQGMDFLQMVEPQMKADTLSAQQHDDISGGDIEKRLMELFPEEQTEPQQENDSQPIETIEVEMDILLKDFQPPSSDNITGGDIENRLMELFPEKQGQNDPLPEPDQNPKEDTITDVFDLDIEDIPGQHYPESASEKSGTPPTKEEVTGKDIAERIGELFPEVEVVTEQPSSMSVLGEDEQFAITEMNQTPIYEEMPPLSADSEILTEKQKREDDQVCGDDVQDRIRELFLSEDTSKAQLRRNPQLSADEEADYTTDGIDGRDTPFAIPDHVLTPTLADIYYQQGQPQLALEIYERLAQRDPEDNSIYEKLLEIRTAVNLSNSQSYVAGQDGIANSSTTSKKKKQATEQDNRPLAGVRIKKKPQNPRRSK